jgi:hypothetical protein
MNKEQLRMQMLAGIITESQYKAELAEIKINLGGNQDRDYIKDEDDEPYTGEGEPYISVDEFLDYMFNLLSQAGYDIPEDFKEVIEGEAYDGDLVAIDDDFPLSYYENFNLQDAKKLVNDMLESLHEFEEMEEYDSIEDFKA